MVLDARVDARHAVIDGVDRNPLTEQVRGEDDAAVAEADLGVFDPGGARLALFVLEAVRVVSRDARRDFLVVVVVPECAPEAELAGGRQPLDRIRLGVDLVVQLRGAHAQNAQVGSEHHVVFQPGAGKIALHPDAVGVGAAKEFVGDQPVVHTEPVGELSLGAAHRWQRGDAAAHCDVAIEHVAQIAAADHLRRITLRGIGRPDVQVVAEFGRQEPAAERREKLRQLNVLALLNRMLDAEGVGVRRVDTELIQVAHVAEQAEEDFAFLARVEAKTEIGDIRGCLLRLRHLRCCRAGDELAAAAIRHPDAVVVVAPALAKEARRRPCGFDQRHTRRRVGRTDLAVTLAGFTDDGVLCDHGGRVAGRGGGRGALCRRTLARLRLCLGTPGGKPSQGDSDERSAGEHTCSDIQPAISFCD